VDRVSGRRESNPLLREGVPVPNQWATPAFEKEEAGELSPPGLVKVSVGENVQEVGQRTSSRFSKPQPTVGSHEVELSAMEVMRGPTARVQ
jgi:hypothetical protein